MEEKLDLYEILKNIPKGLKLYCRLVGWGRIPCISEKEIEFLHEEADGNEQTVFLDRFGRMRDCPNGECVLYPDDTCLWQGWQYVLFRSGVFVKSQLAERNVFFVDKNLKLYNCNGTCVNELNNIIDMFEFSPLEENENFLKELYANGYCVDDNEIVKRIKPTETTFDNTRKRGITSIDLANGMTIDIPDPKEGKKWGALITETPRGGYTIELEEIPVENQLLRSITIHGL